ncbi:flagellar biosynthesis anti-sigma factor FlgM [Marivivens donghaensis]|uniref:Negative regulator of flagellin synthesis n=1 Tax=Marivivens donghaensis TaxID=1699413 RepID=A0ABX0VTS7_9RHOB|nr:MULTISPECIES: flagellar biosynthesis anti-sigma factor FlgM [Marivivens]NIY70908.1 flagellar biosynthesis anti-sigma factor FlgM [Marivivens donghaensis]
MVDSISQSGGAQIKRTADDAAARLQKAKGGPTVGQPAAPAAPAGENVEISAPVAQPMPAELKSGPPVEMELVTRIQEAIANGSYPIDLEKITESLFQSYLELNN